jgi:hypothetical protein
MQCVFIGGYLRTGTTLVQNMLCSSPATHPMIREAVYLVDLLETWHHNLALFEEHSQDYFDDRKQLGEHCSRAIHEHLEHMHRRLDSPDYLVLKRPQMSPHMFLLHRARPDARFIIMIRDPRDVVASAIQATRKGAREFGPATAESIAQGIRAYTLACVESPVASFQERCLYLRYEDQVSHPEVALQLLQEFTGIPLTQVAIDSESRTGHVDYGSATQTERPLHSELYGQPPSPTRIGNYKTVLSLDQIRAVERICGPIIERFRYSLS